MRRAPAWVKLSERGWKKSIEAGNEWQSRHGREKPPGCAEVVTEINRAEIEVTRTIRREVQFSK